MTRKYFGTDGIRGQANTEPMTAEIVLRVGRTAGHYFTRGDHRHRVVIGKDTRLSGYMIEPALTAGFVSAGMDVVLVGPLPTPAVAMLTPSLRADLGVMISASHNSFEDNGIKLFGPDGYKLSDDVETAIEERMDNGHDSDPVPPMLLGRARRLDDAAGRYIEFVKNTVPSGLILDGLRVVVDCANGAAYKVAPTVLWELGADVIPIGVNPDGFNINKDCGSTATGRMQEEVKACSADVGIALDGDADRVIMADETGEILDGDQLMACVAENWHKRGRLRGGGIVATVMSNLGLEKYLGTLGLSLARTNVGDRYVVEHMRNHGFNMGGEQSGHIVLSDYNTTGDGLIAALEVLSVLAQTKRRASEVCRIFKPYPQLLENVRYKNGMLPLDDLAVKSVIEECEKRLGGAGRLVIRKSGTEPLIRVMAEGEDALLVRDVVNKIVGAVEQAVG